MNTHGTNGLMMNSSAINMAMLFMYDFGERILYPLILMGETARQVFDNTDHLFDLKVDKIEFGLPIRQLTPETKSTLTTYHFKENVLGYEGSWEGVPIQIYVIKRNYGFFKNLDVRYYKLDEFKLANPFEAYWRIRQLVR